MNIPKVIQLLENIELSDLLAIADSPVLSMQQVTTSKPINQPSNVVARFSWIEDRHVCTTSVTEKELSSAEVFENKIQFVNAEGDLETIELFNKTPYCPVYTYTEQRPITFTEEKYQEFDTSGGGKPFPPPEDGAPKIILLQGHEKKS